MPNTGKAFSVEESNFGALGWVSDKSGLSLPARPSGDGQKPWPAIPAALLDLWDRDQ